MKLQLKDEIARRLVWSRPDSRIAPFCSNCQRHIPDDCVPLIIWAPDGACVHFCDKCCEVIFEARG